MGELVKAGSSYTDEQRREALSLYAVKGVASVVSRQLNIPETTICHWRKSDWWLSGLEELRSQNQDEHIAAYHQLVREGLKVALDKLPDASAREAAVIAAVATDKAQLLQNRPTAIRGDTGGVAALAKQFAQLSEQWNEKQTNVVATIEQDNTKPD